MNYELAKKLKEAGFPNFDVTVWDERLYVSKPTEATIKSQWEKGRGNYEPTLSELIEACRDRFLSLQKGNIKGKEWLALGSDNYTAETGETMIEAVANFWLALQSKL